MTRQLLKLPLLIPMLVSGAMLPAAAQDRSPDRMMMDGGMIGGGLFGMIFMLLVLLLLVLGIAALIKYLRSK
ncbi:hypothetical protein D1224_10760 [Henriciella barbarensis]|uniref:Uncharacterized protein n=2 Tax=Henriciella TaxID=453849 RepID=A0A399QZU5_9PROT|nr:MULTISPECIES: hypothetical protein [Henriciella]MCH2458678.1 hypothetical protein [Henriciella sp.]MCZ4296427.1 hypothetical protein [Henriciella marina]RIJ24676.1 hypothetical protein D1224_10760 [Henriciella barbarensis]